MIEVKLFTPKELLRSDRERLDTLIKKIILEKTGRDCTVTNGIITLFTVHPPFESAPILHIEYRHDHSKNKEHFKDADRKFSLAHQELVKSDAMLENLRMMILHPLI